MAFPADPVRPEPNGLLTRRISACKSIRCLPIRLIFPRPWYHLFDQFQILMLFQNPCNHRLILHLGKGTGGIQQHTRRPQHFHRAVQDLFLDRSILLWSSFLPAFYKPCIFSEHPLAGARRIHQYLIKKTAECFQQLLRCFPGDHAVRTAPHRQIFQKRFCPACTCIVCHKKPLSAKLRRQMRRFSARCRTQIQDAVTRIYRKHTCRKHRAWLLNVIKSRIIIRMLCHTRRFPGFFLILLPHFFVVKSTVRPRYRFKRKREQPAKALHRNFFCIDPQSRVPFPFIACKKILIFLF